MTAPRARTYAGFAAPAAPERTAPIAPVMRIEGAGKNAVETGRTRLLFAGGIFLLLFGLVAWRLVTVTLVPGTVQEARARPVAEATMPTLRAGITDRNGILLATTLPTVNLHANAKQVRNPEDAAKRLAQVLPEIDPDKTLERLKSGASFVYLYRNLTPGQQFEVNRLGIPGLAFENGERRVYPQGDLFSHVVGMTDIDNHGISGVERRFDERLAKGRQVRLSLDIRVQTALAGILKDAVATYQAAGAAGIVQDVQTGEVIALVSMPDFDPNRNETLDRDTAFNRATLGVYEMGSVFKIFNTAIALESGKIHLDDRFDSTPVKIAKYTIHDIHAMKHWVTVPEILIHSSNAGSARMAMEFGADLQRSYLSRLGMFAPAAVELPEVGAPQVPPAPWGQITVATVSFGHGISVSPLQVTTAASTLVNGGIFRPATLLARGRDEADPGSRVISETTSQAMRRLMRMVVTEGSGRRAEVPGFRVAGKTGTAEKVVNGRYSHTAVLASFLAVFPADAPRYTLLVSLDDPKGIPATSNLTTAGMNAAPTAGKAIAAIAPMLGLVPGPDPFAADDPRHGSLLMAAAREQ